MTSDKGGSVGATIIDGLEMLIAQAVVQFEVWTGETAPRALMEKAALAALDQQH